MRLRRVWAAVAVAGVLLLAGGAVQAQAPPPPPPPAPTGTVPTGVGLNEVVGGLVANNCLALSGDVGPYGPELAAICQFPPTGAGSTTGGTPASETRLASLGAEYRLSRRLRERRAAASSDAGRGFGLFFTADYEKFEQDTTRFEGGFDRDTVAGTLGADYAFTASFILGAAFNYSHEFGNYEGVGGGFDHDTYGGFVYTSLAPAPQAFVDLVAGYLWKDYGFERRVTLTVPPPAGGRPLIVDGPTRGDTTGDELRVSASGGYDFVFGNVTVGPRLGVHYRDRTIDGFRESGRTGLEIAYDNQNITSLTMNAGVFGSIAISTGFGVILPQATIEYVHEFLDDQRSVGFQLVQDLAGRKFRFATDPPDRDYLYVTPGISVVFPGGITAFANFRELVGYRDRSSHAASLGVRIPF
jgi:uncharacterized protein YhjY with autotransporter beta-barrel domain